MREIHIMDYIGYIETIGDITVILIPSDFETAEQITKQLAGYTFNKEEEDNGSE